MRILWHRLLTNPTTTVVSRSDDVTELRVDGLMCDDVCAVRTREALEALPGVTGVSVDLDSGVARIIGAHHAAGEYERAVTGAVALRPIRRFIEHAANVVRRSPRSRETARPS